MRIAVLVRPDVYEGMYQKIKFSGNAVIDRPPEKDATEYAEVLNVCGHHFVIVAVMIFRLG